MLQKYWLVQLLNNFAYSSEQTGLFFWSCFLAALKTQNKVLTQVEFLWGYFQVHFQELHCVLVLVDAKAPIVL